MSIRASGFAMILLAIALFGCSNKLPDTAAIECPDKTRVQVKVHLGGKQGYGVDEKMIMTSCRSAFRSTSGNGSTQVYSTSGELLERYEYTNWKLVRHDIYSRETQPAYDHTLTCDGFQVLTDSRQGYSYEVHYHFPCDE